MNKKSKAESLLENLPHLQNLIKRDPISYKEEFLQQMTHFESSLSIFQLNPTKEDDHFSSLVSFLGHVVGCYPEHAKDYPKKLMDVLNQHYLVLNSTVRKSIVQSLTLLRKHDAIYSLECKDQALREYIYNYIITDIKAANSKAKNNKLNKTLQNFMYQMLSDSCRVAAKKSIDIMIELYKKNIWNDQKTVNVIAEACSSNDLKLVATALNFFLGHDQEEEEEDEDIPDISSIQHSKTVGGKTRAKETKLKRAKAIVRRKKNKDSKVEVFNFSAIHLLNDPQGFTEKLFSKLRDSPKSLPFEMKIMVMNVISRVIGIHKLTLLSFYPFLFNYLNPHQQEVTLILTFAAQSTHELIPPEDIEAMVKTIANNFVADHCAPEVITVGLNSIREICSRNPLAMNSDLLKDLTEYKDYKNKGVVMAARSLIQLFRDKNPELLHRRERGKFVSENMKEFKKLQFGESLALESLPGVQSLLKEEENEKDWDEWEIEEDEEESEGEWIDMPQDEDIKFDDEEDAEMTEEMIQEEKDLKTKTAEFLQTKILTPQDFAKMKQTEEQDLAERMAGVKKSKKRSADAMNENDELVNVKDIEGYQKRAKQTYEERMESIKAGREGREKFGSRKGKKDKECSSTNREKQKKKNFLMVAHKKEIKGKSKLKLRDKQRLLREHHIRQKMKRK